MAIKDELFKVNTQTELPKNQPPLILTDFEYKVLE